MPKRRLRVVRTRPALLGVCERCKAQFISNLPVSPKATVEITAAFDAHKCLPLDSSQKALQIVREATGKQ